MSARFTTLPVRWSDTHTVGSTPSNYHVLSEQTLLTSVMDTTVNATNPLGALPAKELDTYNARYGGVSSRSNDTDVYSLRELEQSLYNIASPDLFTPSPRHKLERSVYNIAPPDLFAVSSQHQTLSVASSAIYPTTSTATLTNYRSDHPGPVPRVEVRSGRPFYPGHLSVGPNQAGSPRRPSFIYDGQAEQLEPGGFQFVSSDHSKTLAGPNAAQGPTGETGAASYPISEWITSSQTPTTPSSTVPPRFRPSQERIFPQYSSQTNVNDVALALLGFDSSTSSSPISTPSMSRDNSALMGNRVGTPSVISPLGSRTSSPFSGSGSYAKPRRPLPSFLHSATRRLPAKQVKISLPAYTPVRLLRWRDVPIQIWEAGNALVRGSGLLLGLGGGFDECEELVWGWDEDCEYVEEMVVEGLTETRNPSARELEFAVNPAASQGEPDFEVDFRVDEEADLALQEENLVEWSHSLDAMTPSAIELDLDEVMLVEEMVEMQRPSHSELDFSRAITQLRRTMGHAASWLVPQVTTEEDEDMESFPDFKLYLAYDSDDSQDFFPRRSSIASAGTSPSTGLVPIRKKRGKRGGKQVQARKRERMARDAHSAAQGTELTTAMRQSRLSPRYQPY